MGVLQIGASSPRRPADPPTEVIDVITSKLGLGQLQKSYPSERGFRAEPAPRALGHQMLPPKFPPPLALLDARENLQFNVEKFLK